VVYNPLNGIKIRKISKLHAKYIADNFIKVKVI